MSSLQSFLYLYDQVVQIRFLNIHKETLRTQKKHTNISIDSFKVTNIKYF